LIVKPKYFLFFIFLLCSFALFSQAKSSNIQTLNGKKYYLHKIEKGQSLYSISKLYQVKLDDIYAENPELRDGTKANQEIKIPFLSGDAKSTATPTLAQTTPTISTSNLPVDTLKYNTYRVSKGETVYAITKKFNLSAEYFEKLNPGAKAGLKEGQLVAIGERTITKVNSSQVYTATIKPRTDTVVPIKVNLPKKTNYNVSLILPFKLNQIDAIDPSTIVKSNMNFPQISALAIDFYLGFKHAADSLRSKDFDVKIDLQDLDDKDSINLVSILNTLNAKQTDFIFGKAKVILNVSSEKDAKEMGFVKAFKQYYNEKARKLGYGLKDTVFVSKGIEGIKKNYAEGMKNVVVSLSNNQVLITDFTTQLNLYANKKDFTLCGWQSTTGIDNIDQEYLNLLNYTFPAANNITNLKAYTSIIPKYQAVQNTYPSEFYFIGFDIAMYYLKNLKTFGPEFVFRLNELPAESNYMRFKFTRPDNSTGFDNNGIYIFKYANYQLVEKGWK